MIVVLLARNTRVHRAGARDLLIAVLVAQRCFQFACFQQHVIIVTALDELSHMLIKTCLIFGFGVHLEKFQTNFRSTRVVIQCTQQEADRLRVPTVSNIDVGFADDIAGLRPSRLIVARDARRHCFFRLQLLRTLVYFQRIFL